MNDTAFAIKCRISNDYNIFTSVLSIFQPPNPSIKQFTLLNVSISNMYEKEEHLKREIGVWGLSANLVNIMVGAGIFVLPAIVAAGLGSASIIAYLFCGFLITLVMLCFAEVGSKITGSGGVYAYIETTFGKYPGFIRGH